MCMYAYICKQACKTGGIWGDAPPGNVLKLDVLRLLLGPFLDKSRAVGSYYFIQFLAVLHGFAKPADFKFPREKVLRLAEQ